MLVGGKSKSAPNPVRWMIFDDTNEFVKCEAIMPIANYLLVDSHMISEQVYILLFSTQSQNLDGAERMVLMNACT